MQELDKERLLWIYTNLLRVRRLEERVVDLVTQDAILGLCILDWRQEAVGVGAEIAAVVAKEALDCPHILQAHLEKAILSNVEDSIKVVTEFTS